jgi:hypothetical protein
MASPLSGASRPGQTACEESGTRQGPLPYQLVTRRPAFVVSTCLGSHCILPTVGNHAGDCSARRASGERLATKFRIPGLFTREWMELVTQKLCVQLKSEHLGEDLSLHIVKNLFYFGRCFSNIPFSTAEGSETAKMKPNRIQWRTKDAIHFGGYSRDCRSRHAPHTSHDATRPLFLYVSPHLVISLHKLTFCSSTIGRASPRQF